MMREVDVPNVFNMAKFTYIVIGAILLSISRNHVAGAAPGPCTTDASFTWNGDGKLYFLKEDRYMRWDDGHIGSVKEWKLPSNIDAALTISSRKDINYIFKGCSVWTIYQNARTLTLGPFHLGQIFRGIPCNLDAATMISGKIYFFKGKRSWRWDEKLAMALESGLDTWSITGDSIDTAFQWEGMSYFLKGKMYWRYDPDRNRTSLGETLVGWPQLVNGPLLPYCACDCTNCCHSNWEFHTIEYVRSKAEYKSLQPETINQHVVDNRNTSIAPQIGFIVKKNISESELFLNSKSESMEMGRPFISPVPLIHSGVLSTSISTPYMHYWAKPAVMTRVQSVKYVSPTIAKKKLTFVSTLHKIKVKVPFIITMKYRYRQCTCSIEGHLEMEKMHQITMSVLEES